MNVAIDEPYRRRGLAYHMLEQLFADTSGDGTRGYTLEVRVSNHGAIRLYERHRLPADGHPARLLHRQPRGRPDHVEGRRRRSFDPRDRDVVRRDVRGRRRGRGGAVEHRRPRRPRCTAGSAASCPRSRRGATSSWSGPVVARRWPTPARRSPTCAPIAVTAGPGLIGALLVGVSAAKAYAYAAEQAADPGRPPARPRRLAVPRAGAARAAVPVPARVRRPHAAARRARPRPLDGAGPEPRRCRRRGLRQGRAPARPRLPRRPGDRGGGRAAAIPTAVALPVAMAGPRGPRPLLLGPQDRAAHAACATSSTTSPTSRRPTRRRSCASLVSRTRPGARPDRRAPPRRGRRRGRERPAADDAGGGVRAARYRARGARHWRFAATTRP